MHPNKEEFESAYKENLKQLKRNRSIMLDYTPEFKDLPLCMVPVSDSRFYVFDKRNNSFAGEASLDMTNLEELKCSSKEVFDSILIDESSDARQVLVKICEIKYACAYLILQDKKLADEFLSYMVIPGILKGLNTALYIYSNEDRLKKHLD